jgi:hypothetical protein
MRVALAVAVLATAAAAARADARLVPPPSVPMSWQGAGAFVWHTRDVDPAALGRTMRGSGFGWVAVLLADGTTREPLDAQWVDDFREASGLPVGGWSVTRTQPVVEARLAARLVRAYGLSFHIANAEREYAYTNDGAWSAERYGRSARFVAAFRRLQPTLPAALSSYCRADQHDLDWSAWRRGGYAFLPQAYVNDFGSAASPRACAGSATSFFPPSVVHPTVGAWNGMRGTVQPWRYGRMLAAAGTRGFSVYLAENGMTRDRWHAYGTLIDERRIARPSPPLR